MIIQCPSCKTRFRLDEQTLAGKASIQVRCSRCRHIFTVEAKPGDEKPLALDAAQEVRGARVVTFSNQKGGVAKTTSCLCIGSALARLGNRVLLVDFDTQANLTTLLGLGDDVPSFYDVLDDSKGLSAGVVRVRDGLSLLPSNNRMNLLPKRYLHTKQHEQLLHRALEPIKEDYDYILVDTPPSLKFFALNGLVAADLVVIPTQCAYLSINGVTQMEQVVQSLRKRTGRPAAQRLLITMYDSGSTAARTVYQTLMQRWAGQVLAHAVPTDTAIEESQILNRSLFDYAPGSEAASNYLSLAKELESAL